MNIIDIANNIDKSEKNRDQYTDIMAFDDEFGLDLPYAEQERLTAYWFGNWYCTDSYVGYRMYFFDDEPVCYSTQIGRKYHQIFHWFSEEAAYKVKEYLITFLIEEDDGLNISLADLSEDFGDSFKIEFNGQILRNDTIRYKGKKAELVEVVRHHDYGLDTLIKIRLPYGELKKVHVKDVDFGFYLKE